MITLEQIKAALWRSIRTFIPAFFVLFVPGILGWLHEVTAWASLGGSTPFPSAHGLGYILVSATVAGIIAVGNMVMIMIEDATGFKILRGGKFSEKE